MVVKYDYKVYEFSESMRGYELLKRLGLNPEEHLIIVDGELYTEDRVIKKDKEVQIVKVTSSG
ncbi:sulfur transfer protein involved in thiamine biosynthesis [Fervidobacterium thailandense]|uniref:Sulfur transfer protein involved in thiamine biosynthesis n=1 Tax=Fervidobacterium thailandense TaxID=1008305 RepID=A0A1E3G0E9_9BACT|nr:sulfur transfer protein involved in thiamine biosynthesis [Fervidobacterium thailandense]ODN29695.1 sulfur transfer protein involved in thiamine biosynthesis [Fervidobacterium thailandense]